jgi:hypothetical protein
MKISSYAGKPAEASMLVNVPRLVTAYYAEEPDPSVPEQRIASGTSGHRGSALAMAFNEWHILTISQAICLYREQKPLWGTRFEVMLQIALLRTPCRTLGNFTRLRTFSFPVIINNRIPGMSNSDQMNGQY